MSNDNPRPLRGGDKVQDLAARLGDAIRTGRMASGQRLVESDIAARHGVSRNSLREALRILAAEGLVTLAANRGAMVRRIRRVDADQIFETRTLLEPPVARHAAEMARADDARREAFELQASAIWEDDAAATAATFLRAVSQFEAAIWDLAAREELVRALRAVPLPLVLAQVSPGLGAATLAAAVGDMRKLADAIASGREEAAAVTAEARLMRLWISVREAGHGLMDN